MLWGDIHILYTYIKNILHHTEGKEFPIIFIFFSMIVSRNMKINGIPCPDQAVWIHGFNWCRYLYLDGNYSSPRYGNINYTSMEIILVQDMEIWIISFLRSICEPTNYKAKYRLAAKCTCLWIQSSLSHYSKNCLKHLPSKEIRVAFSTLQVLQQGFLWWRFRCQFEPALKSCIKEPLCNWPFNT